VRSIRRRLVVPLLAGSCLLTLAGGLLLSNLISRRLLAELDHALVAKARALVTLTGQDGGEVEIDFADEFMPEFSAPTAPEYFQLWLADGTVLERSRSLGDRDLPRFPSLANEPLFRDIRLPDGRPGRMVEIAFVPQLEDDDDALSERLLDPTAPLPDSTLRTAILTTARSRQELNALIRSLYAVSVAGAALLASALGLLVHFSIRHGLRPLDEIGRQVEALDAERLDLRVQTNPPILELNPVVERLNALLARLQIAFERERRFSSDIAHELRTPIAELRNLAGVGGRWPEDRELVRSYFQDVEAISLQMERIVVNLLSLVRCDSGQEVFERTEVDLRELIEETWGRFASDAEEKDLVFELTARPPLTAISDRGKLSLILSNFFSNAVAYSPAASTVSCSAAITGDQLEITVANPAPQLEADDLPHLFDRFWRKDPARSDSLHAGLGLPLAKALADLLGFGLRAELAEGRRIVLRLSGSCGTGV
jgi:two-component system, OmpR family, heavy metal sensor histidine kinase CusS